MKVLATIAIQQAIEQLARRYESNTRTRANIEFSPTADLLHKIRAGGQADAVILTRNAVASLIADATLVDGSQIDLVISSIGVAVRSGAVQPDISTPDAFKTALLAAHSITYSQSGASGIYIAELLRKWGIAEQINKKAVITGGFTARLVAEGQVDLAIQGISELLTVPGIDIVGPLPAAIQDKTIISGGIFSTSLCKVEAREFLAFLRSNDALPVLKATGLERA